MSDACHHLFDHLLSAIGSIPLEPVDETELRHQLNQLASESISDGPEAIEFHEREVAVERVVDEVCGCGPLGPLLRENDISEILINGPNQVFVERRGQLYLSDVVFRDHDHLLKVVGRMVSPSGRRLDPTSPMVDTRLSDGSRMNAVLCPPALNGPLVSIRRFGIRPLTIDDMLANHTLTPEMVDFLRACVKGRINIMISGGTGSGKTTLLNSLSRFIPGAERVVTIEDTAELELQQPHVAKLEAQPPDAEGRGEITMRDLVRNSLRMRPDRIIVGECRGGEAFDMLQAMSTGHEGSMTTLHASNAREAITRVELIVGLAGMEIPVGAIRKLIASSINLIVQVSRFASGKRKIVAISEITGMEGEMITMHDIFSFAFTGAREDADEEGYFRATGIRPHFLSRLRVRGASLPPDMFVERRLQLPGIRGTTR
jgi:pilus assembly protein CpaF